MTTAEQPIKRFRMGAIQLAIWPNRDSKGRSFYTTTIARSYLNKAGQWKKTDSLRPVDLPVIHSLTARAIDWMTTNLPPASPIEPTPNLEPEPALPALLTMLDKAFVR